MQHLLPQQYAHILYRLIESTPASAHEEAVAVFARLLYKHSVLKKIPYIIEEYRALVYKKEGGREVRVTTAHDVPDSLLHSISASFGKNVKAVHVTDSALVGGVVVRENNTVYDASIKTQLEYLKSHIA